MGATRANQCQSPRWSWRFPVGCGSQGVPSTGTGPPTTAQCGRRATLRRVVSAPGRNFDEKDETAGCVFEASHKDRGLQSNPPTPENPGFEGAPETFRFVMFLSRREAMCANDQQGNRDEGNPPPSGSQQTPLNRLLILTSERSPQRLPTPAPLPQPAPHSAFSTEPLHRRLIIFLVQKPAFDSATVLSLLGETMGISALPTVCRGGLKILRNWSSLSYPGSDRKAKSPENSEGLLLPTDGIVYK